MLTRGVVWVYFVLLGWSLGTVCFFSLSLRSVGPFQGTLERAWAPISLSQKYWGEHASRSGVELDGVSPSHDALAS